MGRPVRPAKATMTKVLVYIFVVCLLFGTGSAQVGSTSGIPTDFKSDGCSMFPDGNYRDCCVEHDKTYFIGGSLKERRAADKELYRCVRSKGNGKLLSSMIWIGVRVGGVSFLPTPFRWGFGHKFPRKGPVREKAVTGR
jgi:hypothetical protein